MPAVSYIYSLPYVGCVILCFALYNESRERRTQKCVLIFLAVFFCWFFGLRGFLFTDYINYYPFYNKLHDYFYGCSGQEDSYEIGFMMYARVIKTIFPNYHIWIFISSIIDVIVLTITFKRYSYIYVISWAVFIAMMGLVMECNLLRNFKALDCFLLSIPYLIKRKPLKYITLNIIGATFHTSSLIYIPCYFILNKRFDKKLIIILFAIVNILFVIQLGMSEIIVSTINNYIPGADMLKKMNWYMGESEGYGLSIGYLERTVTFILTFIVYDKMAEWNSANRVFCNCVFLYYYSFYLFFDIPVFVERIPLLFIFSYWIVYPNLLSLVNKKNFNIAFLIMMLFCCLKTAQSNHTIICRYENHLLFGVDDYNTRKYEYLSNPEIQ